MSQLKSFLKLGSSHRMADLIPPEEIKKMLQGGVGFGELAAPIPNPERTQVKSANDHGVKTS